VLTAAFAAGMAAAVAGIVTVGARFAAVILTLLLDCVVDIDDADTIRTGTFLQGYGKHQFSPSIGVSRS